MIKIVIYSCLNTSIIIIMIIILRDSLGNRDVITQGGCQWMTAGRGIIHEEYISEKYTISGGTFEMAQLWVNLPSVHNHYHHYYHHYYYHYYHYFYYYHYYHYYHYHHYYYYHYYYIIIIIIIIIKKSNIK